MTGWLDSLVCYLGGKVARSMGSKRGLKGIIPLIWPTLLMCQKESSCGSLRDLVAALLGVKSRPSKGSSSGPLRDVAAALLGQIWL